VASDDYFSMVHRRKSLKADLFKADLFDVVLVDGLHTFALYAVRKDGGRRHACTRLGPKITHESEFGGNSRKQLRAQAVT
jgi:hypothetical protein